MHLADTFVSALRGHGEREWVRSHGKYIRVSDRLSDHFDVEKNWSELWEVRTDHLTDTRIPHGKGSPFKFDTSHVAFHVRGPRNPTDTLRHPFPGPSAAAFG